MTASLEEAAPKSLNESVNGEAGAENAASAASIPSAKSGDGEIMSAADLRRRRGKSEKKERDNSFVAEGATHDDDFPTFGPPPQSAMQQLSPEEKQRILDEASAYLKRPKPKLESTAGVTGDDQAAAEVDGD